MEADAVKKVAHDPRTAPSKPGFANLNHLRAASAERSGDAPLSTWAHHQHPY